jgi:hypothetical protein
MVHAIVKDTLHADFGDVAALVGAAYPALAARAVRKSMATRTAELGVADDSSAGLGTADAAATVRLTARLTADWLYRHMRPGGSKVGDADGDAVIAAAVEEGVELAGMRVRAGS